MKVDAALVRHVAGLANLELSASEVDYYEAQLSRILAYVKELDQLPDTLAKDWRPDTLAAAGGPTPERPDELRPSLPPDEALAAAPDRQGTQFRVPKIIE